MKPNILLIFPDQHRGDWLDLPWNHPAQFAGTDHLDLRMPNLKQIMRSGTVFTNTVTPSPICAPARACLATGRRYFDCAVPTNTTDFDPKLPTFYRVLKDNGYSVLGAGKMDLHKATKFWGDRGWIDDLDEIGFTRAIDNEGKFDAIIGNIAAEEGNPTGKIDSLIDLANEHCRGPYINYLHRKGVAEYHVRDMKRRLENSRDTELTELDDEDYCDNWLTRNALELLEAQEDQSPWFMQINFTGPHDPWDITRTMRARMNGRQFGAPFCMDERYTSTDSEIRLHYAAMLENIDCNIGLLLEAVERRGELENTVIIYASDHGEMLGDYGLFGKSVPQQASIGVPLVIGGMPVPARGIDESLVELQDLSATILELAGCDTAEFPQSRSLVGHIQHAETTHREVQISALGDWKSISDGRFKYVTRGEREELYAINESEVDEVNNLIEKMPAVAVKLRNRLMTESQAGVQGLRI